MTELRFPKTDKRQPTRDRNEHEVKVMRRKDTRLELAVSFLGAVEYLEDLLAWFQRLPHDKVDKFCERHNAPIGADRWFFLLAKAEELEKELERLKDKP